MKKIFFAAICILAISSLSSCDTKRCYCYRQVGGTTTVDETYTDISASCNSLSIYNRHCVEESQYIDPSQIAIDWKKKSN